MPRIVSARELALHGDLWLQLVSSHILFHTKVSNEGRHVKEPSLRRILHPKLSWRGELVGAQNLLADTSPYLLGILV